MNRLNKTESAIFVNLMCFFLPEDLHLERRVAAVKRLPVHRYSADYIFGSFWIIGFILNQFVNRVPLKPVLGGVGSVAPLHYCT